MTVFYYPGCSSEHLARDLHLSVETLFSTLEIEVQWLEDWNCCGAREVEDVPELIGLSLAARNLALAEGGNLLVTACSLCFYNLKRTEIILSKNPEIRKKIDLVLKENGLTYIPRRIKILHLLDFMASKETLSLLLKRLRGQNGGTVATYYGCFLSRPYPSDPKAMEKILRILGYQVKPLSLKKHCCGGHLPRTESPVIQELCGRILLEARIRKADYLSVACPVCKLNLEIYGPLEHKPRLLYFTQLIGLQLDLPPSWLGITEE